MHRWENEDDRPRGKGKDKEATDQDQTCRHGKHQKAGRGRHRQEVVARYCAATAAPLRDPVWYYAYGLLKLAVVLQQLYARYQRGQTTEARYATMIDGVRGLSAVALRAIARGRIVDLA